MPLQGRTTPEDVLVTCRGSTSGLAILVAPVQLHLVLVEEEASASQFSAVKLYTTRKKPGRHDMRTVQITAQCNCLRIEFQTSHMSGMPIHIARGDPAFAY
jgi:hypothetical protein